MVVYCTICKDEQSPNSEFIFHSLPKDPETREQWQIRLGKKNVKRLYVCSKHFRPEDYKQLCERPLLKTGALPQLTHIKSEPVTETDQIDWDDSTLKTEDFQEPLYVIVKSEYGENLSEEKMPSTSSEEVTDDCVKTLKRNDECCSMSSVPTKKRCLLQKYGHFSRDDFKDDNAWNHFLLTIEGMKKEKEILERENKRLRERIKLLEERTKTLKE